MLRIAIIEDAPNIVGMLRELLTRRVTGYAVETASDLPGGLALVQSFHPDLLVLDLVMPGVDGALSAEAGRTILRYVRRESPGTRAIILSAEADQARDFLLEEGADDFFIKTRQEDWRRQKLLRQVERLIGHWPARSEASQVLADRLHSLTDRDRILVITGEDGVGKRALAEMICRCHGKPGAPDVVSVCSDAPETILPRLWPPRERSHALPAGDTPVVLAGFECVRRLPHAAQAEMAAALAQCSAAGDRATTPRSVQTAIAVPHLVITSRSQLSALLESGDLCQELYAVLERFPEIAVPPLRECLEDVPELVDYFIRQVVQSDDGEPPAASADALAAIERYGRLSRWPGNHGQVRQIIKDAVARMTGETLGPGALHLPELADTAVVRDYSFLFVDVVQSRRMKLGQDAGLVHRSFDAYHAAVAQWAERSHGEVYSTSGDGVMCRFARADDAVRAARSIVNGLASFNVTGNRLPMPFRVRVGIATGLAPDVDSSSGGRVAGEVLDRAYAVQECAEPGEIIVCEITLKSAGSPPATPFDSGPIGGVPAFTLE